MIQKVSVLSIQSESWSCRKLLNNLRSFVVFTPKIEENIHIRVHSSTDTRFCSYVHCSLRFPRRTTVRWENHDRSRNGGGGANIWATQNAQEDETHSSLIENRRTRLERQLSTDKRDTQLSSPGGGGQKGGAGAGTSPPNRVASASASGTSTGAGNGNGNPVANASGDVVSRTQVVRIASGSGGGGREEDTRASLLVPALNAVPPPPQASPSQQSAMLPLVNTAIMSTVRTSVQHASPSTALDPCASVPVTVSKKTQTGMRAGPPPAVPPKPAHLAHYQRGSAAGGGGAGTQAPAASLLAQAQVTFASSGSKTSTFSTHVNSSSFSNPNQNPNQNPNPNQNANLNAPSKTLTPPGGAATQPLWTVVEAPSEFEYDRERDSGLGSDPRSPPHAYPLPFQSPNAYPMSTMAAEAQTQAQVTYPVGYPSGSLGRSGGSGAHTKPSRDGRILINLYDNLA